MREKACVVDINGDQAKVVVTRHSACSKCDKDCILGMEESHEQDSIYVEVNNEKNAEVGDTVSIELKDSSLVMGSLIIYLIPLIFFVGGYFVGVRLNFLMGSISNELGGIITSFIFLYISFLLTRKIDKKISKSNKFKSEMVGIVSKNK
jgi:sigma-E factor negative regulatory protein RseC